MLTFGYVGVSPAVTFSPTSLTFPDQTILTTVSAAKNVTLTNTGLGILTVGSIAAIRSVQLKRTLAAHYPESRGLLHDQHNLHAQGQRHV
jgi:hypothetical protein